MAAGLGVTAFLFACASSPHSEPPPPARAAAPPPLELPDLPDLVPAAGLRFLIAGHPKKIRENDSLRRALAELVPAERLARFAERTGVDLTGLRSALVAGFDLGTLYLAECPDACGGRARALFVDRLAGHEMIDQPDPRVFRVTGTIAGVPHGFVDLDGRIVGIATPDLTLSRVPVAFALGKLKRARNALSGAALSTLPALGESALVTFYAPGPFEGEWARAGHGVLASALALAITLEAASEEHLRITLVVSGEFQQGGEQALHALERAFRELSLSSTGKLLALERARSIRGSTHPQYLTLSAELPLAPLVRGLRAAVIADVWEILDLPEPERDGGRPALDSGG